MKKALIPLAFAAMMISVVGCANFKFNVTSHKKVSYGDSVAFAPTSALGGYVIGVSLSADLKKNLFTNQAAVAAGAYTNDAVLLFGMQQK